MSGLSSYDKIQARRAMNRSFAEMHEQRSAARQEAAQRVIAQGDATRNALASNLAQTNAGQSDLMANIIRTRSQAEAKAKAAEMSKKYA